MNKSKFIRVQCPDCKNIQVVFGKATTKIKCKKCNKKLAECRGGKAKIKCKVIEVLK